MEILSKEIGIGGRGPKLDAQLIADFAKLAGFPWSANKQDQEYSEHIHTYSRRCSQNWLAPHGRPTDRTQNIAS